jgi:hypothetical protein
MPSTPHWAETTKEMKNKYLAVVFLSLAFTGCEKRAEPSAVESARVGNSPLDTYADELVKRNSAQIASFSPSFETLHSPLSYLTVFQSNDLNMLTSEVEEGDSAGFTRNSDITLRWQQMYCSEALQSLMQREGIALASGQIVDASGKKHSLAMCVANQPKSSSSAALNDSTPHEPANIAPFSIAQICKAGLALMYGRDPASMTARMNSRQAQVTYIRPTDDKAMSYRCLLNNGHLLTWDNSIAGARWYGSEPGDTKLTYRVKRRRLIVQDVINGEVNAEKSYSPSEISLD